MLLALALAQATPAAAAEPAPIPPIEEAREQIIQRDAQLFWYAFEGCEPDKLTDILAPDFRMLHDLGGITADSRDVFIGFMREQCAAREPGGANEGYKNRRLSVPGVRRITPLGPWGMLERGYHTFHEWRGVSLTRATAGWEQVGGAHYIHVWQWMGGEGQFRLQESISVDHGAAVPYPPEGS